MIVPRLFQSIPLEESASWINWLAFSTSRQAAYGLFLTRTKQWCSLTSRMLIYFGFNSFSYCLKPNWPICPHANPVCEFLLRHHSTCMELHASLSLSLALSFHAGRCGSPLKGGREGEKREEGSERILCMHFVKLDSSPSRDELNLCWIGYTSGWEHCQFAMKAKAIYICNSKC